MKDINICKVIWFVFILMNLPVFVQGQKTCTNNCDSTSNKRAKIRVISFQAGDPTFKTILKNTGDRTIGAFSVTAILDSTDAEGTIVTTDTVYNNILGALEPSEEVTIMSCFSFSGNNKPDSIQGTLIFYDTMDCAVNFSVDTLSSKEFKSIESCSLHVFQSSDRIDYLNRGECKFDLSSNDTILLLSRDQKEQKVFLNVTSDEDTTFALTTQFNSLIGQGAEWKLIKVGEEGSIFYLQSLSPNNDNYVLGVSGDELILVPKDSIGINVEWHIPFTATSWNNNVHYVYLINEENKKAFSKTENLEWELPFKENWFSNNVQYIYGNHFTFKNEISKTYLCKKEDGSVGISDSLLKKETRWYIHKLNN